MVIPNEQWGGSGIMALFHKKEKENVSSPETMTSVESIQIEDGTVETSLHFPKDWDILPKERYIYQYHHQKLPKIKSGQVSIKGLKFLGLNGELVVEAFIQNALSKSLRFEKIDLLVVDEKEEPMAKKGFSFDDLVEFPPLSSTPWRFLFLKEDLISEATPSDNWKILFEVRNSSSEERLELEEAWENQLTSEQKEKLKETVKKLPKLGAEEVNFTGIGLRYLENQSLEVTVLLRNGTSRAIQLERLPLILEDANGDLVCKGQFELPPLQINPLTAKPWAFVFPMGLILKEQPDFSKWKILVQQDN
jgi:accessory Sec system S-layer assembly protein